MVRNTNSGSNNWGLKEEEESIELDLGLSVGGSYRKQNATVLNPSFEENKDQKTKREIHALRRQEAKKKQQLKRTKTDGVLLKVNDFEPECKKIKRDEDGSDLNFAVDGKIGTCYAAATAPCISSPVPVENGFVHTCGNVNVMPCWFAGDGAAAAEEKNGVGFNIQPVVGYGFVQLGLDHGLGNGYGSEEHCSADKGDPKSGFNGSMNCTSSSGSDHRSPSYEGGGSNSSYTRSHSSHCMQQPPQPNDSKLSETKSRSDLTISNISESASIDEATYTNNAANVVPSNSQAISEPEPYPLTKNNKFKPPKPPSKDQTSSPLPCMPCVSTTGNGPNGKTGNGFLYRYTKTEVSTSKDQTSSPLPCMPCVSTTGNGPNGKTVNGFLYRYTKTEVSIVCVCHGSSFSPAEFVQHAGGTDILHPLRHITVIRSAF